MKKRQILILLSLIGPAASMIVAEGEPNSQGASFATSAKHHFDNAMKIAGRHKGKIAIAAGAVGMAAYVGNRYYQRYVQAAALVDKFAKNNPHRQKIIRAIVNLSMNTRPWQEYDFEKTYPIKKYPYFYEGNIQNKILEATDALYKSPFYVPTLDYSRLGVR